MKDNVSQLISELKKMHGYVDSTLLQSCSCRVHDNPLYSDCVDDSGRVHSDLEYALSHDISKSVEQLVDNVRDTLTNVSDFNSPAGQRHMSLANVFDIMNSRDFEDTRDYLKARVEDAKAVQSVDSNKSSE